MCFNPCFNGSMYKNAIRRCKGICRLNVSILVLMDLCIKTDLAWGALTVFPEFQSLF